MNYVLTDEQRKTRTEQLQSLEFCISEDNKWGGFVDLGIALAIISIINKKMAGIAAGIVGVIDWYIDTNQRQEFRVGFGLHPGNNMIVQIRRKAVPEPTTTLNTVATD